MAKNFKLLPHAYRDLREILGYIRRDNKAASDKMRTMFYDAFQKLSENPLMGQEREDLTRKPVRFWPVHNHYMVIYNPLTGPIQILRIYHNARDPDTVFH